MLRRQCEYSIEIDPVDVCPKGILEILVLIGIRASAGTFPIADRVFHIEDVESSVSHLFPTMDGWSIAASRPSEHIKNDSLS